MYLIQVLALTIYAIIMVFAMYDFRKTVIAWMPLSLLFNPQVCVQYAPQALALTLAVNVSLIGCYFFFKRGVVRTNGNNEPFVIKSFMVFMVISYMISMCFSVIPFASSINKLVKTIFINYGMIYIFFRCLNTKDDVRWMAKISIIVALLITVDGLIEWAYHINYVGDFIFLNSPQDETTEGRSYYIPYFINEEFRSRFGMTRAYSVFALHIQFGTACALLFYLLMQFTKNKWTIYCNKSFIAQKLPMLTLFLLVAGVVCANSKTPMLGMCVIILAVFKFRDIFNIKTSIALIIGIVLLYKYAPNYMNNFLSLTDEALAEEDGGSTVALREMQLNIVLRLFEQSPVIGNGIGAATYFSKNIVGYEDILGAESQWFNLLADQGLLGCIAYIYMYFVMIKFCKGIVPTQDYSFFLGAVLCMETTTGGINMLLWLPILIAIRRYYLLSRNTIVAKRH